MRQYVMWKKWEILYSNCLSTALSNKIMIYASANPSFYLFTETMIAVAETLCTPHSSRKQLHHKLCLIIYSFQMQSQVQQQELAWWLLERQSHIPTPDLPVVRQPQIIATHLYADVLCLLLHFTKTGTKPYVYLCPSAARCLNLSNNSVAFKNKSNLILRQTA